MIQYVDLTSANTAISQIQSVWLRAAEGGKQGGKQGMPEEDGVKEEGRMMPRGRAGGKEFFLLCSVIIQSLRPTEFRCGKSARTMSRDALLSRGGPEKGSERGSKSLMH